MSTLKSLTPSAAQGLVEVVQAVTPDAAGATRPFGVQDVGDGDLTWTDAAGTRHSLKDGWFGAAPAGMALLWFAVAPPSPEWWVATGQAINAATYPICAALYGTNLPNFADRYLVGASGSKSVKTTGGSSTITVAQMPPHSHAIKNSGTNMGAAGDNVGEELLGTSTSRGWRTGPDGGGEPYWPPYLAVNLIIKMG